LLHIGLLLGISVPPFEVVKKTGGLKWPNKQAILDKVEAAYESFAEKQKEKNEELRITKQTTETII
jgi:hypothetical protein